jgi:hypothetical protein
MKSLKKVYDKKEMNSNVEQSISTLDIMMS